ncbi:MAG: hypothetical protein ACKO96_12625, partial [Flammeovirgaceae bacterium]
IGSKQASFSADYFHVWRWGSKRKIEMGVGTRFTSFLSHQQYYSSAPASLACCPAKTDSLLVASPQSNSFNVAIQLGYNLTNKIHFGFTIDAIGFSFGREQLTEFRMGKSMQQVSAQPTAFNILLVHHNDRGMLNSEFFLRYFFNKEWAIKIAYQYLFTEYTTRTKIQWQPEANDRFRNASNLVGIGVTKIF